MPVWNFYDGPAAHVAVYVAIMLLLFIPTSLAFLALYIVLMLCKAILQIFFSIATWVVRGFRRDQG
jgi:hypothetical protein